MNNSLLVSCPGETSVTRRMKEFYAEELAQDIISLQFLQIMRLKFWHQTQIIPPEETLVTIRRYYSDNIPSRHNIQYQQLNTTNNGFNSIFSSTSTTSNIRHEMRGLNLDVFED